MRCALVLLVALAGCEEPPKQRRDEPVEVPSPPSPDPEPEPEPEPEVPKPPAEPAEEPPLPIAWESAEDTVPVKAGTGVTCEARRLDGWLRVKCTKPQTSALAQVVQVEKGVMGKSFTAVQDRSAYLTVPLREGLEVEATFHWRTDRRRVRIEWAQGDDPTIEVGDQPPG